MGERRRASTGIVVIVTGGRGFAYPEFVESTLMRIHRAKGIRLVAAGGAYGADMAAEKWARKMGISCCVHHAKWNVHGKSAGPIRNREMAEHHPGALVVAYPGGAGTRNMKTWAKRMGLEVLELAPDGYGA